MNGSGFGRDLATREEAAIRSPRLRDLAWKEKSWDVSKTVGKMSRFATATCPEHEGPWETGTSSPCMRVAHDAVNCAFDV